ncbi:MAG TPA: glucose 1-dehydrogenase [Chloroflexia bacterium]|nr:glucose 1-dehydrogenase [Chloroflexia bacterium]
MKGIRGKSVLVTGGSSGIGQAIAIRFGEEGANVAINYRRGLEEAQQTEAALQERVKAAVDDCMARVNAAGVKSMLVQADVSKVEDVERMFSEVINNFGGIDILINNAGFQIPGDSDEITIDSFDRVLATNLRGSFVAAQLAIKHFLSEQKPGVIINVSSVHQQIPKPRFVSYSVSKGGMMNLTRTLALEYAGRNIRVNAIGPGATITPINRAWVDDPVKKAEVVKHIPMGRAATSEEMAAVTTFLCSDEASYITGQTLFVDGGLTLYPDFRTSWSSE